jgi:hypothetical protein
MAERTENDYAHFLNGFNPVTDSLSHLAFEDFRDKSKLSADTLRAHQIRLFSENADVLKQRLGFGSYDGQPILKAARVVEIPSFAPDGGIIGYHYRLYPALNDTRYLYPKGHSARPYILPEVWAVREKTNRPLWITEGAKKALKLVQHDRPAISLAGVWNFREGKDGNETFLFDDLERFSWKGRTVFVGFDMDLWTNPSVRFALYELVFKLMSRGAVIRFPKWSGGKGVDDYLAGQTEPEKALDALEDKAVSLDKFISPDHQDEIIRALKLSHAAFDDISRERIVTTIAKKLNIKAKRLFLELKEEKPEGPEYTDEEKAKARELLESPGLVERFLEACHTRYLGRDKTLLLVKLATMTRHLKNGLSVILSGTSSVGKSELVDTVLKTCNPADVDEFSRTSAQYLLYRKGDLDHRIVAFYELNGANSTAEVIRTAITEGKLSLGTVLKDANGSLEAREIRKGTEGLVIISTFTGSRVEPELATRVLLQEITHDEDLARRVFRAKARGQADHSDVFRMWAAADSLIEGKPVDIPFLLRIAELFRHPMNGLTGTSTRRSCLSRLRPSSISTSGRRPKTAT